MTCSGCKTTPRCDKHLTVEKQGTDEDDNGQVDPSDGNWHAAWKMDARFVTPNRVTFSTASGREVQVGNQIQAVSPVILMTPYSSDARIPDPSYRLRMGDRIFNIISAFRVNENGREVQIEAIERKQPS